MRNSFTLLSSAAILIISLFLITSCDSEESIDVSQIDINQPFYRLEQELFSKDLPMEEKYLNLSKKHGKFFELFCQNILKTGSNPEQTISSLKNFAYDSDIKSINQLVQSKYTDLSQEQAQLLEAFKRYRVLFPQEHIPTITTYISGFNYSLVVTDSVLGIGLDMFMEPSFEYYDMLRFPQYRKNRLSRKYLVKDAIKGWLQSEFEKNEQDKTFLNEIVHQGKLMCILDQLLPQSEIHTLFSYTPEQWKWCVNNETNMWTFFVSEKLFYSTSFTNYHKYINEGPFTTGFDRESPDQTGYYIGWRIVDSYLKNNPKTSISELLKIEDPQVILSKSGYKPS
jgi:hypothetical protein